MIQNIQTINRRKFLQTTAMTAVGAGAFGLFPVNSFGNPDPGDDINLIRPLEGYTPHIGIFGIHDELDECNSPKIREGSKANGT